MRYTLIVVFTLGITLAPPQVAHAEPKSRQASESHDLVTHSNPETDTPKIRTEYQGKVPILRGDKKKLDEVSQGLTQWASPRGQETPKSPKARGSEHDALLKLDHLPDHVKKVYGTASLSSYKRGEDPPNCHGTTCHAAKLNPELKHQTAEQLQTKLKESGAIKTDEPAPGDVVLMHNKEGTLIHSAVHVSGDKKNGVVYSKNGMEPLKAPPLLHDTKSVDNAYSKEEGAPLIKSYYRVPSSNR